MKKPISEHKKNGRPYEKFTTERVDAILKDLAEFVPQDITCKAHGVTVRTFLDWMYQGEEDLEQEKETDFTRLLLAVNKIKCAHIKHHVGQILETPQGHRGSEWILRRAYWKYFSDRAEVMDVEERLQALEHAKHSS